MKSHAAERGCGNTQKQIGQDGRQVHSKRFASLPVHQQLQCGVDDAICGRLNREACEASEQRGVFFA